MSRQAARALARPVPVAVRHLPVMAGEVIEFFASARPRLVVDGTAGGGGHLVALVKAFPKASILAVDRDPSAADALAAAWNSRSGLVIRRASYTSIPEILEETGLGKADAALFDLGLSSLQLDDPARGFSHSLDGPLDMRFDRGAGPSASELVNGLPEADLADIFWRWGGERWSRRIARAVVSARPVESTLDLASAVRRAVRGNPVKSVSRVFQALRIAVNRELSELETLLDGLAGWMAPGGRAAFITFHSLEDRIVKRFFMDSPDFTPCRPAWRAPTDAERLANPRARSAKLRTGVRS